MDRSIRDRFDLRQLIPTDKAAREYDNYRLQCCLWHVDDDPSLLVYRDGYRCQSCGERGDVVDWIQFSEGLTFPQALHVLQQREPSIVLPPRRKRAQKPLPAGMADSYHCALTQHALDYYHSRGLSDESILAYRLGYGPPPHQAASRFSIPIFVGGSLVNIKFRRDDTCQSCNSPITAERDGDICCDNCGTLWTPEGPKYLGIQGYSTPTLFNDIALDACDILIVEGEFDAIMSQQHGVAAVSSTGGSRSFRKEWVKKFHSFQRVYAAYDNDAAGETGRASLHALFPGLRDITLPVAHKGDITDFIQENGGQALRIALQEANRWHSQRKQLSLLRRWEKRHPPTIGFAAR